MPWKKGETGNPKGRPKKGTIYLLEKAVKRIEKVKGKKWWDHVVETAWDDPVMMNSVNKKLLPDLKQVDSTITGEVVLVPMSPAEKLAYQEAADKIAQEEVSKTLLKAPDRELGQKKDEIE